VRVEKYGLEPNFARTPTANTGLRSSHDYAEREVHAVVDAGYQKFLLTDDGLKFPALAKHLEGLRKFNEELRTALGVPTFYNEAIGSVSQVSVYDRVKGRQAMFQTRPWELTGRTSGINPRLSR